MGGIFRLPFVLCRYRAVCARWCSECHDYYVARTVVAVLYSFIYGGHSIRSPAQKVIILMKKVFHFFQLVLIEILSSIYGRRYLRLRIERKSWPDTHHCYYYFFFLLSKRWTCGVLYFPTFCVLSSTRATFAAVFAGRPFLFAGITLPFCGNEKNWLFLLCTDYGHDGSFLVFIVATNRR